jgi:magnesium-transporting ATPase (P-type)
MNPYRMSIDEVARALSTHVKIGLSHTDVKARRKQYGPNKLPVALPESWVRVFFRQFESPLIYILLVAAAIIFFTGPDKLDAFIISGVLFFNAIVGAAQEGRTHSILESLQRFLVTNTVVIRDGVKELVRDEDLVVGDLIVLQEGQRIPADARIIESNSLELDESPLTGESKVVRKETAALDHEVSIADRTNMVYRGTHVLSGSGKAIVIAVGINTEIGKVHSAVEEIESDMPLKREIERLVYWIVLFIFVLCLVMLFMGMAFGKSWNELLAMLTALFICVVPEAIPVVLTLVLARGAYQMAQKNVLVKRMQAVEALGRTDVIVIDKTGTLTRNEMMVLDVIADGTRWKVTGQGYREEGTITSDVQLSSLDLNAVLYRMGRASLLLNSTEIIAVPKLGLFDIKGDPTEAALFVFAKKLGLSPEECEESYRKVYEIPFSSQTRYHAAFFEHDGQGIIMVIGAPEDLIARSQGSADEYKNSLEQLLAEGLRVVAIAEKKVPLSAFMQSDGQKAREAYEALVANDLTLLGLCGMQDAIRADVKDIIEQARSVGIQVVMATGDHKRTAMYVAQRVGLLKEGDKVMEGDEFRALSDAALLPQLSEITVYARVSPEDKLRIIELFHKQKKIVAMTGDGINDAPSLVAADLGIAMGRIGTEVAKQASDVILLDDSFASIMQAVEQGRYIFDSLKRVILYFFATNMGEILIVLFALLADLPLPIAAAQILWLNLVTDGFLDIALSMEPKEEGLLTQKWLSKAHHLVDLNMILKMFYSATPMAIGSLSVFIHYYYATDIVHARTMTLITMAMFQWFNAWNCRSQTRSIFQLGFFANPWLLLAIGFVFLLQIVVTTVPFMQYIFKTVPLSPLEWFIVLLISSSVVILEELRKWVVRLLMRWGYWAN